MGRQDKNRQSHASNGSQAASSRHSGGQTPDKNRRNRANGARKVSATSARARSIKASSGIALPRSEAGELESLIGGIRSSGIRAKKHVTSTPVDPEPSAEERKRAWQPPVIDTSRFDGNRSSRHSSTPSDRTAEAEGWHGKTKKRRVKKKPLKAKNSAGNNTTPRRRTTGTATPYLTTPLTDDEFKSLDNAYRIWGAKPEWKGWNKLLPRRTGDFLLAEARRLGLTRPDDLSWTLEEARVYALNRNVIAADSGTWATLLPRKSASAIERAYGVAVTIPTGRSKPERRRAYRELATRLSRMTKEPAPKPVETATASDELTSPITLESLRSEWEHVTLSTFYEIYGPSWDQWRRIVPWLHGDDIASHADELGLTVAWDDEEKEAFIASEGINWTGDELDMLIYGYPIRSDASPDWGIDLPWHTQTERSEVAEMIGLPSKEMMSTLAAAARHLA